MRPVHRQGGFAHAAHARDDDDTRHTGVAPSQELIELLYLCLAAGETAHVERQLSRHCHTVAGGHPGRRGRGRDLVAQDLFVELSQLRGRLQADQIDQVRSGAPVDLQRLALPTTPVEGEHQQASEMLPARVFLQHSGYVGHDLPV